MEIARNSVVGVLGYGVTGQSVLRYLANFDCSLVLFDTRKPPKDFLKIPGVQYNWQIESWSRSDIDLLFVSPGVRLDLPILQQARDYGIEIVSDLDLFFSEVDKPVFGITGTNGKSTVTTMLGHVFARNGLNCKYGGNLGVPALDLISSDVDVYILELSSFQLERAASQTYEAATILNITEDHLDHHLNMDAYIRSKHKIFSKAKVSIFNRDDKNTFPTHQRTMASFGSRISSNENGWAIEQQGSKKWVARAGRKMAVLEGLGLNSHHAELNVLCVIALAFNFVDPESVIESLQSFKGLDHRYKRVAIFKGVEFINDSKATNLGAVKSALENYTDETVVLIAGGEGKGSRFEEFSEIIDGKLKTLIVMGRDGGRLAVISERLNIATFQVSSIEEAVEKGFEIANEGDTVLLSPACASLDMFKNFEERGQRFELAVRQLINRSSEIG